MTNKRPATVSPTNEQIHKRTDTTSVRQRAEKQAAVRESMTAREPTGVKMFAISNVTK